MKSSGPYAMQRRLDCPFYGFNGMIEGRIMVDSIEENQCGLITNRYSLCQMEMEEQEPNWHECPLNTEEKARRLEESAGGIQVFPREFQPPTARAWPGLSLKDWMNYILN